VNNMFSKAAVWLVIGLVLFTVFRQFDTRQVRGGDLSYSQFMEEAKAGRIENVMVDGRTLRAKTKEGRAITVYSPGSGDIWMISDLMKFGVQVAAKPEEEQSLLMNIFISWFPMLLLIGVWVFFMRQMQGGGRGGAFSFGKSRARMLDESNNPSRLLMWQVATKPRKKSVSWSSSCATRPSSRSWAVVSRGVC